MIVWVLAELWDDGDPGDHAHVQKVRVFHDMETARAALLALDLPRIDCDPDDLRNDWPEFTDIDEITQHCRQVPEMYTWTDGRQAGAWFGGRLATLDAVEVEP